MGDAAPDGLKGPGDNFRRDDAAWVGDNGSQPAAQVQHLQVQGERREQLPATARPVFELVVVHGEHGLDGLFMAITENVVGGLTAGRAEVRGVGIGQIQGEQTSGDRVAVRRAPYRSGRAASRLAGGPENAGIQARLHGIQARPARRRSAESNAPAIWNTEGTWNSRSKEAACPVTLPHSATRPAMRGNTSQISGDGLRMNTIGPGGTSPIRWISFTTKALPEAWPG